MTIPYIWLGNNTEVNVATGGLALVAVSTDKWTIRPLLGWNHDSTGITSDTFTPALLIRQDNPLLQQLLSLVDAIEEDDALVTAAIGSDWHVFRFNSLVMELSPSTTFDLATLPTAIPVPAFIQHNDSITLELTTPATPPADTLGLPVLKLNEPTKNQVITSLAGDAAIFTLSFALKELNLGSLLPGFVNKAFNLVGKTLKLAFDTATSKLSINDIVIDDTMIPSSGSKLIPLMLAPDIALIVEEIDASQKIGFEIQIDAGSYKYEPLIPGIVDSQVILEWSDFRVRLFSDCLGLAAPLGLSGDELMTATFRVPLIQAKVGVDVVNALAKLVPAEVLGKVILAPLEFAVTIKRPEATTLIKPESLFWKVNHDGTNLTSTGELIQSALEKLNAVYKDGLKEPARLTSFFAPLKELTELAESGLAFTIGDIEAIAESSAIKNLLSADFNTTDYHLPLALRVESGDSGLIFLVVLRLNLWKGQLSDNRAYFYIVDPSTPAVTRTGLLDLISFAIQLPIRTTDQFIKLRLPDEENHDGYLDFEGLDIVLDVMPVTQSNRPQIVVLFPGDLVNNTNEKRRVRLLLEDFVPNLWPEPPQGNVPTLQLRLGARGLTFAAKAETVTPAVIPVPGISETPLSLRLIESRDGLRSGLVVIDNQVRYANLAGQIDVPGFDALQADIQLGLRRTVPEGPLEVIAVIDLERSDRKPLAQLKIPFLKIQLDDLRMQLTWKENSSANKDWNLQAWASGALSITNDLGSTGGIKDLDQPRAIPFRDLDLTQLHQGSGKLPLGRRSESPDQNQPVSSPADELARFELLEGQFRIEFHRATLEWNLPEKTAQLEVERARFDFQASSGELDVAIEAGKIELKFNFSEKSLQFKLLSSLGLEVRIGTQIKFVGEIGWKETPTEKFFFAGGRLQMTGFPEVAGSLKLGTGIKEDGSTAPNLAIFAKLPYEADLFSGVVMKEVGLGLGLNNRLAAIGSRPEPRDILARIDQIDPEQPQNWSFVSERGVYVSVVATTMLGSNRGEVVCAYLAKLILSIDTNINIVAVAQIWLFSSPKFLTKGDNERRPALVGAAVLRPQEQTFSLVAQTMPRPAIEGNKMLSELLSRVQARFSFYLSPDLADYYMEELSYREELFGISVLAVGSYRIAIGRFGALMRASLALRGDLPQQKLSLGIGGFTFSGNMQLDADFGGLVSSAGLTAYGAVRVGISLRVSAYIMLPTIAFETRSYEKTFSISISIPYLECRRWRCKWKMRDISETVTVRITLIVPVVKIAPYHLPETTLDLILEGALAFDESGGIGFSGTLAISTSICGHSLRIAPRFDYRPEVVNSVRGRVAAVENQINQLRGLPRSAVQALPADNGAEEVPPVETWYYYTSRNGDDIYHLLVPSPEYPTWWYTPRAAGLSQYANLPRDTEESKADGGASDLERRHLSPFRGAVMRMVLPFKDKDGKVKQVVDLSMPWDRSNYDALPNSEAMPNDEDRIALVMKLTEIEAAFLNTAAKSDIAYDIDLAGIPDKENDIWKSQEEDPNRSPLNGVDIVSDPRPESGARVYWSLTDQMTRPDDALPYRYRPVNELVAEGFTGVDRRNDIGRLLRYEAVRRRAMAQGRIQGFNPHPTRRLAQDRAGLLSTILADFVRESGPQTYAPMDAIRLVRTEDGEDKPVVARRRTALWVSPDPSSPLRYFIRVTYAILENSTDLDLEPDSNNQINIKIKWTIGTDPEQEQQVELVGTLPKLFDLKASEPEINAARHNPLTSIDLQDAKNLPSVQVIVSRESASSAALKDALLIFEPLPERFVNPATAEMKRQVGLFAITKDDIQLDFSNVRIIRNEENSSLLGELLSWASDRAIRIVPMTDPNLEDPIEAIQRWVSCLHPCQEFLTVGESNNQAGSHKVRVRLPVKFEEELLKSQLPRLNGFEIYRRFPWEPQPVKIAEGVPPIIQRVDENNRTTLLVESFLFGEDFPYNSNTQQFEGVSRGVIPGVTQIEYFLRAIPYGRLPLSDAPPTFRRWPTVTLHVPPMEPQLPALGLVVSVESLFLPEFSVSTKIHELSVQLVDSNHVTWDWPAKGWEKLEIWAEPRQIRSTGSYAIEDEPAEGDPLAAQRREIQSPRDLTIERLPESVVGKIKIAELTPDRASWVIKITSNSGLNAGRAYRLFIRPSVTTEIPLAQPMPIYLIRGKSLPSWIESTTPLCHAEQLEFVSHAEYDRILPPIKIDGVLPHPDSWLLSSNVTISHRSSIDPALERLRIAWNHLSDLDAGVEIFIQDVDEPHRIDRRLVTTQQESIFQTAIRDFHNPAVWHPHPEQPQATSWTSLDELRSTTPSIDEVSLLLWRDERNPVIERVHDAFKSLLEQLEKYTDQDWVALHRALSEYQFALLAYQRTPLAPATSEDREGLNALAAIARALLLGREVPSVPPHNADPDENTKNLKEFYDKLVQGETDLRKELNNLAAIDLSTMTVSDTPSEYERIKKELQDIDLAQKFAEIVELRLAIANDLLDPDASHEDWISASNNPERLPSFSNWGTLLARYNPSTRRKIISISNTNPAVVTTASDHGLTNGEQVLIVDVIGMVEVNEKVFTVELLTSTTFNLTNIDSTGFAPYVNGGNVQRRKIISISNTNPAVVTTASDHGLTNGEQVLIVDVIGMVEVNEKVFTVELLTSTTFNLTNIDSTGFAPYVNGGNVRFDMERTRKLLSFFDKVQRREIMSISNTNPAVVTTASDHGLTNGEQVLIVDVIGMVEVNEKVFTVELLTSTTFNLTNIDSTGFAPYVNGGNVRFDMERTRKLLTERIRDPSVLLDSKLANDRATKYREEVAKLVPQAAGLTAAIDTLKRDAKAQSWTLLRRPHHQLGIASSESNGKKAVSTPLRLYLPDSIGGPNPTDTPLTSEQVASLDDDALVMPFVNLLERFGFAIDLAVVDALNQPLPQARLLDWIAGQAWSAIKSSIGNDILHDVVLIAGREPDTDRDRPESSLNEDQSLGYAFVKLAVVPRSILAALLGQRINVTIEAFDGTATITIDKSKEDFTKLGWSDTATVSLKLPNDNVIVFKLSDLNGSKQISSFRGTSPGTLPLSTIATAIEADHLSYRKWLVQRAMLDSKELEKEVTSSEEIELKVVQRMTEAWWHEITSLNGSKDIGHVIVEMRGRRWATVPILGGRAHLDWQAFDSSGHEIQIAVRRVSRYEAILRWALGTAVPTLSRLYGHGLGSTYYQSVELRRRMRAGVEEATTLPVFVSPHPTRIEFIYALPTSAARAAISGLSARRNGYQGIIAQFFQERLKTELKLDTTTPPFDVHEALMQGILAQEPRLGKLTVNTVTSANTWEVTSDLLTASSNTVVVFSIDHKIVRLSTNFLLTAPPTTPNSGTLTFATDAEGLPNITTMPTDLAALVNPLTDIELEHISLRGFIKRVSGTEKFQLTLDQGSDRLDEDRRTYIGQLLIVLDQKQEPIHARLIDDFQASDQTLTIETDPLPTTVLDGFPVRILLGAKPLQRDTVTRPEAGEPALFRNERLISLPALPYFRKYSVELTPQFDITEIEKVTSSQPPSSRVFGQRRSSTIAVHAAHLIVEDSVPAGTDKIYTLRLVLTQQGDHLTPAEKRTEANLDNEAERLKLSTNSPTPIASTPLWDGDLPDLACQYQVVWRLPGSVREDPVYVDFVDVLLPGHPLWTLPTSPATLSTNPVFIRSLNGENLVQLLDESENPIVGATRHVPILLWWTSPAARPIYVVKFKVKVLLPAGSLFEDPTLALLQVQRDGYRSRPLPISNVTS